MTLLNKDNLASIESQVPMLESHCVALTGLTPYEVGCHAMGVAAIAEELRSRVKAACVPVTSGGGLIGNFSYLVADIIRAFTGAQAFVTEKTDVSGFQEAISRGADIVFMADDDSFVAYNTITGACSDNSNATGRVFAALLDLASGEIDDDVLVLGAGKAGVGACRYLSERGVAIKWFDPNVKEVEGLDPSSRTPDWGRHSWKYVIDATNAPKLIKRGNVTSETVVAALGVPFGMTRKAVKKAGVVINEELAFGTIAMFGEASSSLLLVADAAWANRRCAAERTVAP